MIIQSTKPTTLLKTHAHIPRSSSAITSIQINSHPPKVREKQHFNQVYIHNSSIATRKGWTNLPNQTNIRTKYVGPGETCFFFSNPQKRRRRRSDTRTQKQIPKTMHMVI